MKKRTKLQLVKLLRKTLKERGTKTGLCWLIYKLFEDSRVTDKEYGILCNIIQSTPKEVIKAGGYPNNAYYWEPGQIPPRLTYLNLLVKRYSPKTT